MKVKKLIAKLYEKIILKDKQGEKKVWLKIMKKSLKHKHTEAVK